MSPPQKNILKPFFGSFLGRVSGRLKRTNMEKTIALIFDKQVTDVKEGIRTRLIAIHPDALIFQRSIYSLILRSLVQQYPHKTPPNWTGDIWEFVNASFELVDMDIRIYQDIERNCEQFMSIRPVPASRTPTRDMKTCIAVYEGRKDDVELASLITRQISFPLPRKQIQEFVLYTRLEAWTILRNAAEYFKIAVRTTDLLGLQMNALQDEFSLAEKQKFEQMQGQAPFSKGSSAPEHKHQPKPPELPAAESVKQESSQATLPVDWTPKFAPGPLYRGSEERWWYNDADLDVLLPELIRRHKAWRYKQIAEVVNQNSLQWKRRYYRTNLHATSAKSMTNGTWPNFVELVKNFTKDAKEIERRLCECKNLRFEFAARKSMDLTYIETGDVFYSRQDLDLAWGLFDSPYFEVGGTRHIKTTIYQPINLGGGHWTLMIVDFDPLRQKERRYEFLYWDPLGEADNPLKQQFLEQSLQMIGVLYPEANGTLVELNRKIQTDSYACGPLIAWAVQQHMQRSAQIEDGDKVTTNLWDLESKGPFLFRPSSVLTRIDTNTPGPLPAPPEHERVGVFNILIRGQSSSANLQNAAATRYLYDTFEDVIARTRMEQVKPPVVQRTLTEAEVRQLSFQLHN